MEKSKLYAVAAAAFLGLNANAQDLADGQYYIQNVESGLFLCGGNSWGTRASVSAQGDLFSVTKNGETYTITDLDLSSGNKTLGYNLYTDTNPAENGNTWTIASAGAGAFTIYGKGKANKVDNSFDGFVAQGTEKLTSGYAAISVNSVSDAAKWKFITADEVPDAMKLASVDKPVSASFLLLNANFSRNHAAGWTVSSDCTNKNLAGGSTDNMCAESFHSVFTISQSLNVPNGVYALTAQGFYRQDGTDNDNLPYFFANNVIKSVPLKTGAENSMANASASFANGLYTIDPIYVQVTDGVLNVGVKNEKNNSLWVIFDNFELKYYGDVSVAEVQLAEYVKAYNEALAAVNAINKSYLSPADKSALEGIISDNTVNLSTATQNQLETAATNLNNAVAPYSYKAKIGELKAKGDNADWTELLANPSFETGNMSGWTNNSVAGMWTMMTRANAADPKVGNYWIEKYGVAGKLDVSQTLTGLPAGTYRVSVLALDQASKAKLVANGSETAIVGGDKAEYSVDVILGENEDLKLGVYCENHDANKWVGIDDFKLTYVGAEAAFDELVAATGKMNATIASTQSSAIAAFNTDKTVSNYNAAKLAITAAEKSVKAYEAAKTALDAQKALVEGTNVYGEGYDAYKAAYQALQAKYNDNTLADEAVVNPNVATGHRASTAYNFLLTPWKIGGTACNNFDAGLYINTWSTEGNTDGSDFKVPFFEYWVADANSLADNTLSAEVNVPSNGLYKVSVLTRVRAKNGVAATEATGIALKVNEGEAVDATEGAQVGETQFSLATVEAEGLVKDGILRIALEVEGANISWLSFKDVKYTKVRDLTAAEMAVAPTAIALNATSAALKPGQQTTLAVTKVTPDDATETVTWSSSDDKVATVKDGVVTAVGEGTATITATSTVDESIKATATISVAIPSVLANASFDEGTLETGNVAGGASANSKAVAEWTSNGGAAWCASAAIAYGEGAQINGGVMPAADATHKGGALGISAGWNGTAAYTQTIKLPAGNYTLSVDVYNANAKTDAISKVGFIADNGTSYLSDKTSYKTGEWETETVIFKLTEETVGKIQIGIAAGNTGSGNVAKVFFDNIVIASKTDAEIEAEQAAAAAKALAEAKDAKKADFDKLPVGDGLFYYSAANVAAAKANVDKAATIDAVAAVAAPVANAPKAGKAYAIKNTTADGYLTISSEGIKVTENAPVYFEAVDGGYVLSNGEAYLAQGANAWSLKATDDKAAALKVNVAVNNGSYEIKNVNGSLGLDNTGAGSTIFANKNAAKNGLWTVEDWVAPKTPELAITDGVASGSVDTAKKYDVTYSRTFNTANKWQSLYVPFDIDMDGIDSKKIAIAKFENVELDADGTLTITIAKVQDGVISANTPLFIAAKTAGTNVLTVTGTSVAEPDEEPRVMNDDISNGRVVVRGVLTQAISDIEGTFVMSGGSLKTVGSSDAILPINRWFMNVETLAPSVRIRIVGLDDEDATAIASAVENVTGGKVYSINGGVSNGNGSGIYIQNGKKFIRK